MRLYFYSAEQQCLQLDQAGICIYEQKTSLCMCCTETKKQKNTKFFLTNFRILLILSHVCEW